jgi:hypothetical protein
MTIRPLSRTRALLRKTTFKVGAVVLASGAAAALLAAPASAATASVAPVKAAACAAGSGTWNWQNVQFSVDNCPGSGAGGWAWLNAPAGAGNPVLGYLTAAALTVTFANGNTAEISAYVGNSTFNNWWGQGHIVKAQACEIDIAINGSAFYTCSGTVNLPG